jgi:hypothetical protein
MNLDLFGCRLFGFSLIFLGISALPLHVSDQLSRFHNVFELKGNVTGDCYFSEWIIRGRAHLACFDMSLFMPMAIHFPLVRGPDAIVSGKVLQSPLISRLLHL